MSGTKNLFTYSIVSSFYIRLKTKHHIEWWILFGIIHIYNIFEQWCNACNHINDYCGVMWTFIYVEIRRILQRNFVRKLSHRNRMYSINLLWGQSGRMPSISTSTQNIPSSVDTVNKIIKALISNRAKSYRNSIKRGTYCRKAGASCVKRRKWEHLAQQVTKIFGFF